MPEQSDGHADTLVAVELDGHTLYVAAHVVNEHGLNASIDEYQIASRGPKFEHLLESLAVFARQVVTSLQNTGASKVTAQFGCEIAVESGSLVAIVGKASAKSSMTISLEWAASPP